MSENHKKIWITGASSGIGNAVAEKFAKEGWKVAVSARRKELLDELAKNENIASFSVGKTVNKIQIAWYIFSANFTYSSLTKVTILISNIFMIFNVPFFNG